MASNGVQTPHLPGSALSDEVLGNRDGSTVRQSVQDLATQLAGSGAVADQLAAIEAQVVSGLVAKDSWADLLTIAPTQDGTGAEVSDVDTGTHSAATASGYDGAQVPNAGRYSWIAGWARWQRIGDTTITGKSDLGHGHAIGDVHGLQLALDGKAAQGHDHAIGDIAGLQTALAGKAAADHGHAIEDITGLQDALDALESAGHSGRPGEDPLQYAPGVTGLADQAAAPGSSVQTGVGQVRRIAGAAVLGLRERIAIEAETRLMVTWALARATDPSDPSGDLVRCGVQWLGADGAALVQTTDATLDLQPLVEDGRYRREVVIGAAVAPGVGFAWPAGAVYAVPFVQTFGADGVSDIERLEIRQIPALTSGPVHLTASGGPDALLATADRSWSADPQAETFRLAIPATNTGSMTLAVDGAAPAPLLLASGAEILAGYLVAGAVYDLLWDGSAWRLTSGASAAAIEAMAVQKAAIAEAKAVAAKIDAAAALASAQAAASDAASASAARSEAQALAQSVGAPFYPSAGDGAAATNDGDVFLVLEGAGTRIYERQAGVAVSRGWQSRTVFDSVDALRASGVGIEGEIREIGGDERVRGRWIWVGGDRSYQVARDPQRGVYATALLSPTGAGGCWVRQHVGTVRAEWFGPTGTTDDSDAVQACDEFFREFDEALDWELTQQHTTYGIGDILLKESFATMADVTAALADPGASGLVDYDVIKVLADESQGGGSYRYRVRSGALQGPLSNRGYNGKRIYGRGAAKRNGFKLKAGAPGWMRLFAGSFSDGVVERVIFNGDNPSPQWGNGATPQNNPDTELLVEVDGYGLSWRDVIVRFSGGDGVKFRGLIGNMEWSGGDCVSQYNIGWGVWIDKIVSFKATKMWVEGNVTGDILLKHDINEDAMTAQQVNTATTFAAQSSIEIESIYSENADPDAPVLQVEGGHFAPRVAGFGIVGAGAGGRLIVHLKDSAESSGIYKGCKGGFFGLGGHRGARIICEGESWGNIFERAGGMPTLESNGTWSFQDAGRDNEVVWAAPDEAAFIPGAQLGNVGVNIGNSTFANSMFEPRGTLVPGGILGPHQDYATSFPAGPSCVKVSGTDTRAGGSEFNYFLKCSAELPATVAQWYAILALKASADQTLRVGVYDQLTGDYYNWYSGQWDNPDDPFGNYRVLRADKRNQAYSLPFMNDGQARKVWIQMRIVGASEVELYHGFVTDIPHPDICSIRSGELMGTRGNAESTTALLAPATAVPANTRVFDRDARQWKVSDGATWAAVA